MLSRLASFVPDCLPSNQPDKQRAMGRKRKASRAPATQEVVQRQTGKAATGVAKPRKAVQVKSRTKKGTTRQQRPKKQPVEEAEPTDSSDELSVSDDEVEQAALHSDDPDSADTNSSDEEDEEEYSSEYGSSDLDSSDSEDDQDGGSGDKSQVLGKEVGSSGHVAGYGSWVKAEPIEKHGVLEEVKTSGKQLRMHVDDLESDDEEAQNTIGNVPLEWYNDYDHIGYDIAGNQIAKPAKVSHIDRFLQSQDDPNFRWKIMDEKNGKEITLSRREVELLRRIQTNKFPHPEFNAYPDYDPWFTKDKEIHPLGNVHEPKRRFQPSKWEKMKILKIMKRIQMGTYKVGRGNKKPETFLLWGEDDSAIGYQKRSKAPQHIPAPKLALPGHASSYNPPEEYLLTKEEEAKWEEMEPERRPLPFIPRKYKTLRHVPLYQPLIRERFERCLDLYLCPRAIKRRLQVDPETLLPKLPSPDELRPYPTTQAISFDGHTGRVRAMSVDSTGQWLVTGSDDKTVRLWEVDTGRCVHTWTFEDIIQHVAWNPNPRLHLVAVAVGTRIVLLSTGTALAVDWQPTWESLSGARAEPKDGDSEVEAEPAGSDAENADEGARAGEKPKEPSWAATDMVGSAALLADNTQAKVEIELYDPVKHVVWHRKGDYLASVCRVAASRSVSIHQVSRRRSQRPFKRNIGLVQCVTFHPTKPMFYCANQRNIRVYNLLTQTLEKKLVSGCKWISSIDMHATGDHLIVGSYDKKVVWFDLELSSQPFKILRYNKEAVRRVSFHPTYPLMATAGDDGSVHVLHAKVFGDFLQNPLIVPVKVIKAHERTSDKLGVLGCVWHPTQPWVFTAGADKSVKLFQNIP